VDHRDTINDLIRKGRDLERLVLAAAVRLHLEDKVLVSRNKTVVFD
jgi:formyltetrahydrofolate deformylase